MPPLTIYPADDVQQGVKNDADKPRWDLLPFAQIGHIVQVITFGAKKYSPGNWKKIENPKSRYFAALMRHLSAWHCGEKSDSESGLRHLAHAGCCLLFLMWHDDN